MKELLSKKTEVIHSCGKCGKRVLPTDKKCESCGNCLVVQDETSGVKSRKDNYYFVR